MSAAIDFSTESLMIEDVSLDDALDMRKNLLDFIDDRNAKIMSARKALADVNALIELRMEEKGQCKFVRSGWSGRYEEQKSGSASVFNAEALRAAMLKLEDVP